MTREQKAKNVRDNLIRHHAGITLDKTWLDERVKELMELFEPEGK